MLSHEIRPGKMPDCIYFQRGGCTSADCQYRHAKVNPNASYCKYFQEGYCQFEIEVSFVVVVVERN